MNLCEEAESLLLHQFSQSPKFKSLLLALITPFNDADVELQRLHHGSYIDQASDTTLDIIGSIVGQHRYDMNDEDYRPWIKVAICLNNSSGTPESVLTVLRILFGKQPPVTIKENLPNDVTFTFYERPKFPIETLFSIIRSATPVTTACHFNNASPPEEAANDFETTLLVSQKSVFCLDITAFDRSYFADFFGRKTSRMKA